MLSIIAGKPGSGKTYHMATILVDMLTDWVRYELKNGERFDSTIWTNIVFRSDGLNETIGKRLGQDVDVSKYMNFCDDVFFNDPDCTYWWQKFPAKSVIIIDEVHFYLGQKVQYGSLDCRRVPASENKSRERMFGKDTKGKDNIMGMMRVSEIGMTNISEESLAERDNVQLSYPQASLCSECGTLPRMVSVFRDNGYTRLHRGFVVQCPICGHDVIFVSSTRTEALKHWNKLQRLEQ